MENPLYCREFVRAKETANVNARVEVVLEAVALVDLREEAEAEAPKL